MPGTCGYGEGLSGSTNVGNFLTSCKVYWLASQEGLCSMEQVRVQGLACLGIMGVMGTTPTSALEGLTCLPH